MAQQFPLPAGTLLPEGTVEGMTSTSYRVSTPDGGTVFVPFYGRFGVHETHTATPLVTFG